MSRPIKCRIDDNGRECTNCGIYKPWSEFWNAKHCLYGKSPKCADCVKGRDPKAKTKHVCGYEGCKTVVNNYTSHCKKCVVRKRQSERAALYPIGTKAGRWTTIGEPFFNGKGTTLAKVQCECGTVLEATNIIRLVQNADKAAATGSKPPGCRHCNDASKGSLHHMWKGGDDMPREPSSYLDRCASLQGGLCAWCHKPLFGATHVDHNHNRHKECSGRRSCWFCIRGAVHPSCNFEIKHWDWALNNSLGPIPEGKLAYLSQTRTEALAA